MRIGVVHQYRLATSGSGRHALGVVESLLAKGHQVCVMSHDEEGDRVTPPGSCWHGLRLGLTPVAYARPDEPDGPLFSELSDCELESHLRDQAERVSDVVRREKIDVLHANQETPGAAIAARVRRTTGVPYVVVAHGSTIEYVHRADTRYQDLTRAGLREAERVIALNAEVRSRLLAICPDIEPRVATISPGVDVDVFHPRAADKRPPPGRGPTLAYLGRLSLDKGVHVLIAALPRLVSLASDLSIVVVGDGPARAGLERLVDALDAGDLVAARAALEAAGGADDSACVDPVLRYWHRNKEAAAGRINGRTRFTGRLEPEGVAAVLAASDILVVPSLVTEAYPLVVLEALACGVPVVATARGGLAAVLDELEAPLAPWSRHFRVDGDVDNLVSSLVARTSQLLEELQEPGARDEVARRCRRLAVDRYSWARVVSDLEEQYEAAVTSARGDAGA